MYEIPYYDNWRPSEEYTIRKLQAYIENGDRIEFTPGEKEEVKKLVGERRHELLVELLRPFPAGPKIHDDFRIYGNICDYHELENGYIRIIFEASTPEMYRFMRLAVNNNLELRTSEDNPNVQYYYPRRDKPDNPVINIVFYPYEYYFEIDVDCEIATRNNWLISKDKLKYVEDKDAGTVIFTDDPEVRQRLETEKADYQIRSVKEIEQYGGPEYKVYEEYFVSGHRFKLELRNHGKEAEYNPKAINPLGRLCFVDDEDVHSATVSSTSVNNPSNPPPNQCRTENNTPNTRDLWNDLFKDYWRAEIYLYNSGFGQCIGIEIEYSPNSGKHRNLLIFDYGRHTGTGHWSDDILETAVENDLIKRCEAMWNSGGKVYFMVSHNHRDHCNKFEGLLGELQNRNHARELKDSVFIFPHNTGPNSGCFIHLMNCTTPYIMDEELGTVISVGDIKVCQGRIRNGRNTSGEYWKNASSIMLQLKKIIMPADCFYSCWPDEFGKDSNNQDKIFDNLILPHHGYLLPCDADSRRSENKAVVDRVCDGNTQLYVSRDDPGDVDAVRNKLGIDQNPLTKTYALSNGSIYVNIQDS
ncbi:hypothetical protein [Butyrivibrio sp. AE2032]|uniref:hypothetical protein n=1 Tax=Butyrivibrio sp. AE2032 TaxID=1458463 RepID=UPI00054D45B0|nr:hypothetical protein [Butyrivibrio sp. AE2032]